MSDQPATALLGDLLADAKELVTSHGKLVKLEVREELAELKETIVRTGVALAGVVLAGLLLSQALALGLSDATGLPPWATCGIVGVVLAVVGIIAYRGRAPAHKIDLIPDESIARVRHDLERVADAVP